MLNKKKKILCILSLSILTNIAYAGIPGITKPYDPPNYYSATSVSIPDSAPSEFTLKDLKDQGYKVHDVMNNKKDIISDIKTYTEYLQTLSDYNLALNDLTHNSDYAKIKKILDIQEDEASSLASFYDNANLDKTGSYFYDTSSIDDKNTNIASGDKYTYMDNIYKEALNTAQNQSSLIKSENTALNIAINNIDDASSTMDIKEANSLIDAVSQIGLIKQQQLTNMLTALIVTEEKNKRDEQIRAERDDNAFFNVKIEDPYNPSDYYKKNYTKQTGKGFVDFE